jgi:hypothetical protein
MIFLYIASVFLGDIFENPEMLQVQVMGVSNWAYLYPDIEDSTVCYAAQARGFEINMVTRSAFLFVFILCYTNRRYLLLFQI